MKAPARRTTHRIAAAVVAAALASCSPATERRAAAPADTARAAAPPAVAASPRTTAPVTAGASAADSARGIVERIGSEPAAQRVVRTANGTVCALRMTALPPIEGLEVTLWGRRDLSSATMIPGVACTLTAERYAVRAVDGIAAVDGILRSDGAASAIETADGVRRPLRDVPSTLRTQGGARIYWAGPLDRAPAAYGVLAPPP